MIRSYEIILTDLVQPYHIWKEARRVRPREDMIKAILAQYTSISDCDQSNCIFELYTTGTIGLSALKFGIDDVHSCVFPLRSESV